MAKKPKEKPPRREMRPSTWALIAMGVVTGLVFYAGFESGNWRGVVVTEIQVLVVGGVAWYGLRR